MHGFPGGRRLYAALFVGLVVILGASLNAGAASAQAPPPPGPTGTVVNLCTGGSFDQSLDEVAATLGVTRDELRTAIQTTVQGVAGTQQGANAGTLQQVITGPSSGLCSAQVTPATPSQGAPPPQGGPSGPGSGMCTITSSGPGQQPNTTGCPGATCTVSSEAGQADKIICSVGGSVGPGQPPPGTPGTCHVRGSDQGLVTGPQSCTGTSPASGGTTACTSSSSAGVGIVTSSSGSTIVGELTAEGYGTIARNLGHGTTGEQVRAAFCTVRR